MQVQKQTQQIPEEDVLIPLSEDEQDSIQGGLIPLGAALLYGVVRLAVVHHGRRAAAATVNSAIRANAAVDRHPKATAFGIGVAGSITGSHIDRAIN